MWLIFCISNKFSHDSSAADCVGATLSCMVGDFGWNVLKERQYEGDCICVITFLSDDLYADEIFIFRAILNPFKNFKIFITFLCKYVKRR